MEQTNSKSEPSIARRTALGALWAASIAATACGGGGGSAVAAPTQAATGVGFVGDATTFPTRQAASQTGRVRVSFHGDSVFKGWGFGTYNHPSPLNAVWSIVSELLAPGRVDVRYGSQMVDLLWMDVVEGKLTDGDFVFLQNAGPHFNRADLYESWLRMSHQLATWDSQQARPLNTNVFLTTTYSDGPYAAGYYNSDYSSPVTGGRSINQVIQQYGQQANVPVLLWDSMLAQAVAAQASLGVKFIFDDKIHPTALGNALMALSVYQAAGLGTIDSVDTQALETEIRARHQDLVNRGIVGGNLAPYSTLIPAIKTLAKRSFS